MWWILWMGLALGQQTSHEIRGTGSQIKVSVAWTDGDGRSQDIAYQLPRVGVESDRTAATTLSLRAMEDHVIQAVRAYAETLPSSIDLSIVRRAKGLEVNVSGAVPLAQLKQVRQNAAVIRENTKAVFREEQGFMEYEPGVYAADLPRFSKEYRDALTPLANELAKGQATQQDYIDRVLHFVQAIPYEVVGAQRSRGSGYRRPLAVLADNAGDCDSKAVLFLAMVGARYPKLPAALFYLKDHVYVGLGLATPVGSTASFGGQTYTLVEPVGPAMHDIGTLGTESAGKPIEQARAVPTRLSTGPGR